MAVRIGLFTNSDCSFSRLAVYSQSISKYFSILTKTFLPVATRETVAMLTPAALASSSILVFAARSENQNRGCGQGGRCEHCHGFAGSHGQRSSFPGVENPGLEGRCGTPVCAERKRQGKDYCLHPCQSRRFQSLSCRSNGRRGVLLRQS